LPEALLSDEREGQGVRGLSPKASSSLPREEERGPEGSLCVSFECDSLSEELRKKKGRKIYGGISRIFLGPVVR
jgi:hypothetical protein